MVGAGGMLWILKVVIIQQKWSRNSFFFLFVCLFVLFSSVQLNLSNSWDTGGWVLSWRVTKGTVLDKRDHLEGQTKDKDEETEEQKGNRGLSFSTSVGWALSDIVVAEVVIVGTRVYSDGSGQSGTGSQGEDNVEEIQDGQQDWPGKDLDEIGEQAVDGGEQQAKGSGEDGKVHLRVVLGHCGGSQGAGETQDDHQETKVDDSQSSVAQG